MMKRILVLRFSAMGDVAMSIPVIMQVLENYPNCCIFFATQKKFFDFFPIHERLILIDADIRRKHKSFFGVIKLFSILRKYKIDVVCDLHDVLRTKIIDCCFRLMGVKTIQIDKQRSKRKLLLQDKKTILIPTIQKYAEIFAQVGYPIDVAYHQSTTLKKQQLLHIGFAPFASFKSKELLLSTSIKIIHELLQKYPDAFIYILGGMEDNTKIQSFPKDDRILYLHKLPLKEQLLYIRRMDLILSMDSANMHLASLYKIPVVSIWCGTSPLAGFLGFGQSVENAIQPPHIDCRPCSIFGTQTCSKGDFPCTQISVQEILNNVGKVMT